RIALHIKRIIAALRLLYHKIFAEGFQIRLRSCPGILPGIFQKAADAVYRYCSQILFISGHMIRVSAGIPGAWSISIEYFAENCYIYNAICNK
ncbi:MAG: hypothetical protein ACLSAP_00540, partial [Oscillospiraceae bacterium]